MRRGVLAALTILLAAIYLGRVSLKAMLTERMQSSAVHRHEELICEAYAKGEVTATELCSESIPEIVPFRQFYDEIRKKDGEWYEKHGWRYYPVAHCSEGKPIEFEIMGHSFRCSEKTSRGEFSILENAVAQEASPAETETPVPTPAATAPELSAAVDAV